MTADFTPAFFAAGTLTFHGPAVRLLNNFKISLKVGLIAVLMAVVTIGTVGFAAMRLRAMADANIDMVTRVDRFGSLQARAGRQAERYLSLGFQLVVETTEAGNARLLAEANERRKDYESLMAQVLKALPEEAVEIEPVIANFKTAFAVCDPAVHYAATVTTNEDNLKAAVRLREECAPQIDSAIQSQSKLIAYHVAKAAKAAEDMALEADLSIRMLFVASGFGLLTGLAVAMWIGIKGLARPINELKSVMEAFVRNDLNADVPGTERRDEVGDMARTVEVFKKNGLEVAQMRSDQQALELRTAQQRKADMVKLAGDFEGAIGEIIDTVSSASTQLETSAGTLSSSAARAQELTAMVAAASEEASTNVQSVASATEELSSSVNEISRQVQESARMANEAVDQARKTNDRVSDLSKAASRIGDVVELINTIAGQTNLLALNATIEAARAGEAGRGFAVVASEVKALAEQTAKATGEIGLQITGIQAATQESVGAIREISGTIEKLSGISSTIAAAVEEQGAATQEISRNVQQAAQGTQQVSANITDVQRGASETGSASSQVLSAAQSLSSDSNRLKLEVGKFLNSVRAA
jgi:methyl-accepting chemotaxis protein